MTGIWTALLRICSLSLIRIPSNHYDNDSVFLYLDRCSVLCLYFMLPTHSGLLNNGKAYLHLITLPPGRCLYDVYAENYPGRVNVSITIRYVS